MANRYKDLALSFKAHPLTGDLMVAVDAAAVTQSIRNIILTAVGESPFSDFGSTIQNRLFDLFSPENKRNIEEELTLLILKHEPRVIVKNVTVTESKENYSIQASITYQIKTIDEDVTFTVFLRRA